MSANLATNNKTGEKSVFVVKEPAWHREGVVLDEPATAAEAIQHGGLDYEVVKVPAMGNLAPAGEEPIMAVSTSHHLTVRTDTRDVLGSVGNQYTIIQNADAFGFFDQLVERDVAMYTSAGALGKGEKIWVQAKMPEYIRVGKDDMTEVYVTLTNSHDGFATMSAYITPIRVVCENTLRASLGQNHGRVAIRHTKNAQDALNQAAKLLEVEKRYISELDELFNGMAKQKVTSKFINDRFVTAMFPLPVDSKTGLPKESTRIENQRETFLETLETGRGQSEAPKGTAWWLWNGYTRYLEDKPFHGRRNNEVEELLNGSIHQKRQKALQLITAN